MSFFHPRGAPHANDIVRRLFHIKGLSRFLGGILSLIALSTTLQAGNVNLTWDGSANSFVTGYNIHYGEASGAYTSSVDAGPNLMGAVTGLTPGLTYYFAVAAYNANGNESPFSNEVTNMISMSPSIIIQPVTQTAVAGLPVTLNVIVAGDASLGFQWLNGLVPIPGATNSFLSWPQIGSSDAGAYTVMVSNPWGSTTSSIASLTVVKASSLSILNQLPSQAVVITAAAAFSAEAAGTAPLSFQWYDGTTAIPGATNSVLSWAHVADSNAGSYYFTVSNATGMVTSSAATLTVIDPPSILMAPLSQAVAITAAAAFTADTAGTAPLSFQWYDGRTAIPGATNSFLAWASVAASNAGNYHFTVSNAAGLVTSSAATLMVIDLPSLPSILMALPSQAVVVTAAAAFSAETAGTAPLAFQWYDGRTAIPGATNSVLAWSHVADSNAGSYHFTVSNAAGLVISSAARLTVIDLPSILMALPSQAVVITAAAAFTADTAGTAPLAFQWYDGTTALAGATNSVLAWASVADSNAGSYHFTVSNAAGLVTSAAARLTVIDLPSILMALESQAVVMTTAASFSADTAGTVPLAFQWYDGTTALAGATNSVLAWASVAASNAGSYHFTVSNAAGLVTSAAATLMVLPTNAIATSAGAYNGLFFQTNADGMPNITEATAGFLGNCVVAANGAYTAKVYVGGVSYALAGVFNISGDTSATIPLGSPGLSNLTAVMHLDLINGTRQMTGSVSSATAGSAWTAPLVANLATNAYPQFAWVNLSLSPGSSSNSPSNDGMASGVVVNGVLSLSGILGDTTAISQTVPISMDGNVPLYVNLYKNGGLLEGWINLADGGATGSLTWIFPGSGPALVGGFNTVVQVTGTTSYQ